MVRKGKGKKQELKYIAKNIKRKGWKKIIDGRKRIEKIGKKKQKTKEIKKHKNKDVSVFLFFVPIS